MFTTSARLPHAKKAEKGSTGPVVQNTCHETNFKRRESDITYLAGSCGQKSCRYLIVI